MVLHYDHAFNPPAPVVNVIVFHPVSGNSSQVIRGKLDSGADITVIPTELVTQLMLSPKGYIWVRGYEGLYSRQPIYYIRMKIEGFDLPSVRCVSTNRQDVLLGRNVLNRFIITLDGKNLTLDLQDP